MPWRKQSSDPVWVRPGPGRIKSKRMPGPIAFDHLCQWCTWCLRNKQTYVTELPPACSFWPAIKCLAYKCSTCDQHNAIHSRQAGVGAGVGVDMKIPTPESESTPVKTLSTPQPCLKWTILLSKNLAWQRRTYWLQSCVSNSFLSKVIGKWRLVTSDDLKWAFEG